jgi:HlyD family secretion protein/epimerase transport system membrane fusion protein
MTPSENNRIFSTRKCVVGGWVAIALFFGSLGAWSAQAPIASAIIASGVLVVETSRKAIQHLEGGIVAAILVRDGDRVTTGQTLVELESTSARSRLSLIRNRTDTIRALLARLTAERDGAVEITFSSGLIGDRGGDATVDLRARQIDLFEARRRTMDGQQALMRKRSEILYQQITGLKAQQNSKIRQLELIRIELEGVRKLYEKGIVSKTRLLALERAAARLSGERGSYLSDIAKVKKEIAESDLRIVQLRKDFTRQVIEELASSERQLVDLREQEAAASDVLRRTTILSPANGVVVGRAVHSSGEVIAPGKQLMEIVPDSDRLIVEAKVRPQDIDKIHQGQGARVRFVAFDQKTVPMLPASVTYVSADSLETRDKVPYYSIRLELSAETLSTLPEGSRLIAGMPVEIFINSGEQTLFTYITKPLATAFHRALRES